MAILRPRRSPWPMLMAASCWAAGCGPRPTPPLVEFRGHSDAVTSLAFAPDGRTLATRGGDDRVRIWDVATRREISSVPGFDSDMGAVAFSPDGARLVANEAMVGVVAWDPASGGGRLEYRYPPQPPALGCYSISYGWGVDYAPDGRSIAAGGSEGGDGGFVALWDVGAGEGRTAARHDGPVTAVAFSPDGLTIASGGRDGAVCLWDLGRWGERARLRGHDGPVAAIAYAPGGSTLASAGRDRVVRLWDVASGREVGTFAGHGEAVDCVAFRRDGRMAASGDRSGRLLAWDPADRRIVGVFETPGVPVLAVAFAPDGLLATGGRDGVVRFWPSPRASAGRRSPRVALDR